MEECYICFSSFETNGFEILPCSHKICSYCHIRLENPNCPLCRKQFNFTKEQNKKRIDLGIKNKYSSPSVQQENFERNRLNDFNSIINQSTNRNTRNNNSYDNVGIGIVGRQRYRRKRRNLSEEEIKEKRKIIREKCRRKWMIKENRLNKVMWYDL